MKIRSLSSDFVYSAPKLSLMRNLGSEVAFIGRSNAGKSSLINALCGKDLARTSKTPGRTRHAVVYRVVLAADVEKVMMLIDMPGFGFALMSKTEAEECEALIFSYLAKRTHLRAIVLLLDIRRDLDDREQRIVEIAKARGIEVMLVLTKSDKLAVSKRSPAKKRIAATVDLPTDAIHLHTTHDEKTTRFLRKALFGLIDLKPV